MKRTSSLLLLAVILTGAVGCSSGDSDAPAANVKIGKPGDPGPKPSAPSGAGGGASSSVAASAASKD